MGVPRSVRDRRLRAQANDALFTPGSDLADNGASRTGGLRADRRPGAPPFR